MPTNPIATPSHIDALHDVRLVPAIKLIATIDKAECLNFLANVLKNDIS
jgi:hypothetical protein